MNDQQGGKRWNSRNKLSYFIASVREKKFTKWRMCANEYDWPWGVEAFFQHLKLGLPGCGLWNKMGEKTGMV